VAVWGYVAGSAEDDPLDLLRLEDPSPLPEFPLFRLLPLGNPTFWTPLRSNRFIAIPVSRSMPASSGLLMTLLSMTGCARRTILALGHVEIADVDAPGWESARTFVTEDKCEPRVRIG
jgi:hypothetical protein